MREKAKIKREKNKKLGIKILNPLEKAKANPTSFRFAANAMCYQCIYDKQSQGSWRAQAERCTSPDCALYALRPKSIKK